MSEWVQWDEEPTDETGWDNRNVRQNWDLEEGRMIPEYKKDSGWRKRCCPQCGATIHADAEICPNCGIRLRSAYNVSRKNEGMAAVLSFLFCGLGQIYNGQLGKGIIFCIIGAITVLSAIIFIGFILYPLFWIYNIYDAYNTAKKINAGQIVV
jgi:TM2 domain-containing membrane protein YozV